MTAQFTWGAVGSVMHLLTTEMNSLAVSTLTSLGPEINNSSGYQMGQLDLTLASAAFVAGNSMSVYLLPSNDTAGGTYPTLGTFAQEALANYLVGVMFIKGTTAAQRSILPYVPIPLGKFKCFVNTNTGTPALASSGNTLDLFPTPTQY